MVNLLLSLSFGLLSVLQPMKGYDLATGKQTTVALDKNQKYRVIVFLSARCPCSASHEAKLQKIAAQYKTSEFQFVAVHSNADEDEKLARAHFSSLNLGFPVIQDSKSKIADQFQALKTPHVFVVDKSERVLYQGGIDDSSNADEAKTEFLADALKNLKENKPVEVAETRALGCRIQRP